MAHCQGAHKLPGFGLPIFAADIRLGPGADWALCGALLAMNFEHLAVDPKRITLGINQAEDQLLHVAQRSLDPDWRTAWNVSLGHRCGVQEAGGGNQGIGNGFFCLAHLASKT